MVLEPHSPPGASDILYFNSMNARTSKFLLIISLIRMQHFVYKLNAIIICLPIYYLKYVLDFLHFLRIEYDLKTFDRVWFYGLVLKVI